MHETNSRRVIFLIAALIALSLLSLLAPLPRTRAVSETPWLVELATTLVLGVVFAYLALSDKGFISRLFTIDDAPTRWIVRFLVIFTFWGMLSAAWASSSYLSVHHALLWGEYILFFLFVRERLTTAGDYRLISYTFASVAGVLGILCIIEYATMPDFTTMEGVIRARYGAYSELLVTIVPVLAALGICAVRTKDRLLLSSAAALGWLVVMLSLSKGAFLAGVIGLAITFGAVILFAAQYRRRAALALLIWLVLTAGVQAGFSILSPVPATVDYISGKADPTRGTALARVFVWKIGAQMIAGHPMLGVGADNFGISFNDARASYRTAHPADPPDEPVSDNLVMRGHNELLQVTAELGIVGLVLFLCPFAIFGWALVKRFRFDLKGFPPVLWAALGGMAAFFVSSMASSFSFRLAQNGIAFFMVFALAVSELTKLGTASKESPVAPERAPASPLVHAALALFFLSSIILLGTKAYAERYVLNGDLEPDKKNALDLYSRAYVLDPGYASAYLRRSGRYYGDKDFGPAAADLRKAIDRGSGVVITYSALAAAYEKAGDRESAEDTFNEALGIFPRSVFLHVRYAMFLGEAGRSAASEDEMTFARGIDRRQAGGWYNLFKIGSVRAFYAAREDPEFAAPAELLPEAAVLEYLDPPPGEPPQ